MQADGCHVLGGLGDTLKGLLRSFLAIMENSIWKCGGREREGNKKSLSTETKIKRLGKKEGILRQKKDCIDEGEQLQSLEGWCMMATHRHKNILLVYIVWEVLQSARSQQYKSIVLLYVWLIQSGSLYNNAVSSSAVLVHSWVVTWTSFSLGSTIWMDT